MEKLPDSLNLSALGIDPSRVKGAILLRRHEAHAVYRLFCGNKTFVLKWFPPGVESVELRAYALLSRYGVPAIAVHGKTESAILLEDLNTSSEWRLANVKDNVRAEVGVAVAEWYKAFHSAGRKLLSDCEVVPPYLRREADALDAEAIIWMGDKLGSVDNPLWHFAAEYIEELKSAIRALPTTLNYNDFDRTNLALSRQERPALRAIVFDYDLLGIGPVYADYRNVVGSLDGAAREAFREAFGPVDAREAALDTPVSILYSLHEALRRPRLPGWATSMLAQVVSGELEQKLRSTIAILSAPPESN